ncbi:Glycosylphosphatidylinositol:protein transamidase, GAA1 component [Lentithecium fluviatile CBS 122367]|uniref:Glycosylphosphatidylinositol:protein transamidase, GAA1 component n=1 Tax=Lentithecium fluviatile CBS 122367 TaxID=1168545 RepID=A0A6G1IME9_9PLEO|nr:Glycosylphosphatidylinositol:protein transamidase, GAA1 component [Lentithecium fluviatile CBS 122367]
MALISSLLALRRDARILKLPPYLSALLIIVGVAWLLVLPLNEYSRNTYVSENALLPGQVHTYFTGSEHNVFRAYRQEVAALPDLSIEERNNKLADLFRESDLKVAKQKYTYQVADTNISNENVYAVLQGPRADATEAIVLIAAWKNMADEVNYSGVALVLALARYFKRWSLWSKDIIFLIPGDSTSGPQAWVDAYHDGHDPRTIESLAIKSGALQGAVAVDYPAGPWGHRYDKLHIVYDGVNGQLPNLDLFNTAVSIASGQMGIGCTLQRMWKHSDTYEERLQTMLRGMLAQGLGHATGPHSSFIPYHVDAITLVTVGDGWHDEMSLGRTVESLFRSLNNLLEHLHQSFFFYLLLQANRFVSIGTYLPSAMLIAANFSIMAIALWVQSGRPAPPPNPTATKLVKKPLKKLKFDGRHYVEVPDEPKNEKEPSDSDKKEDPTENTTDTTPPVTAVSNNGSTALVPTASLQVTERALLLPLLFTLSTHFLGLLPLYAFNLTPAAELRPIFIVTANILTLLPLLTAWLLRFSFAPTPQQTTLIQSFSLLLLGMFLSALATLNFSLSFMVGVLCAPLSFVRERKGMVASGVWYAVLVLLNPVMVCQVACWVAGVGVEEVLLKASEGWAVWGLWTQVVVWGVWFPAWFAGSVVVALGFFPE